MPGPVDPLVPRFPFPALAALVGRQAPGQGREVALACLMGARLLAGALPPLSLPAHVRAGRARAARAWLASLVVPVKLRAPFGRLYDVSAEGSGADVAVVVRLLVDVAAPYLDPATRLELEALAASAAPPFNPHDP